VSSGLSDFKSYGGKSPHSRLCQSPSAEVEALRPTQGFARQVRHTAVPVPGHTVEGDQLPVGPGNDALLGLH
jgi:hypothetical protein